MKYTKRAILSFMAIILLSSCKKENTESSKADEIAARYGLTKSEFKSEIKFTKTFSTLEEFEKFLKIRRTDVLDSITIKSSNTSDLKNLAMTKATRLSIPGKIMDAYGGDSEDYGPGTSLPLSSTFSFPGFADAQFPDKVVIYNFSPWAHTVAYSCGNFGSYTYVPVDGKTLMYEGNTIYDKYLGEYTEIYGVGGLFTYYRNFHFTMDVRTHAYSRSAVASYIEY